MRSLKTGLVVTALGVSLAAVAVPALAQTTLTLGSWRTEDLAVWQDQILPAFNAAHPDIKVEFAPINTNEYNAAIQSQIEGGAGPDLITCRPFDVNNEWIQRGYFASLEGAAALGHFTDTAKAAWTWDGATYCVPVAAVLAGYYYNVDIFNELGLTPPNSMAEFTALLQKIKDSGKYEPLALGSAESWQLAYTNLYSFGQAYW
jgi:raffinose/stachyose/melibiose transport system substrate-binding protein